MRRIAQAVFGLATALLIAGQWSRPRGAAADSFSPDLSRYATSQALDAAMSAMQSSATMKQPAIPVSGPGAGKCQQTIVPSELVTSGGVAGTSGTCSRILQCGTSASYVVTQFNVGNGC